MKRILVFICACLITFWTSRIYSVNRNYTAPETRYKNDSMINIENLEVSFNHSCIYTCDEFESEYKVEFGDVDSPDDIRIISACFDVRNTSENDLAWDTVMDSLQCGFESLTWASSVDPSVTSVINTFYSDTLKVGATQRIGFATVMTRSSFREQSWEHLTENRYYYVFARQPEKIMIELDLSN